MTPPTSWNPGNIIVLNGTSSSGKTTVARALQEIMDAPYLHTGVDHFLKRLPRRLIVSSDGVHPASADGWLVVFRDDALAEVPRIGPVGYRLLSGMYQAIAAFASAGNNVIVDDVIYDRRVLKAAVDTLRELPVLFVGLRCPLEVAERRERERDEKRAPGGAKVFHDPVHAHGLYDLEVDTSIASPIQCALQIREAVLANHLRTAFRQLARMLTG